MLRNGPSVSQYMGYFEYLQLWHIWRLPLLLDATDETSVTQYTLSKLFILSFAGTLRFSLITV